MLCSFFLSFNSCCFKAISLAALSFKYSTASAVLLWLSFFDLLSHHHFSFFQQFVSYAPAVVYAYLQLLSSHSQLFFTYFHHHSPSALLQPYPSIELTRPRRESSSEVFTSIPVRFSYFLNLTCIFLASKFYQSRTDHTVTLNIRDGTALINSLLLISCSASFGTSHFKTVQFLYTAISWSSFQTKIGFLPKQK